MSEKSSSTVYKDLRELNRTVLKIFQIGFKTVKKKTPKALAGTVAIAFLFNVAAFNTINNYVEQQTRELDAANMAAKNNYLNISDMFFAGKSKTTDFTEEGLILDLIDYDYDLLSSEKPTKIEVENYDRTSNSFTNDRTSKIQWPFPTGVPISSSYGYRDAPCKFCSSNHKGIDFDPGLGAGIQAVADGVVVETRNFPLTYLDNPEASYGSYIIIKHNVAGVEFESLYAHLMFDSIAVFAGDEVKVGDFIGQVGETGIVTGAHLHFEIRIDGEKINPYPWLVEMNAKTSKNSK